MMRPDCGCRCHGGPVDSYCCPECEPEAYDICERCGELRYQHDPGERTAEACEAFYDAAEDARAVMREREAAGQMRIAEVGR